MQTGITTYQLQKLVDSTWVDTGHCNLRLDETIKVYKRRVDINSINANTLRIVKRNNLGEEAIKIQTDVDNFDNNTANKSSVKSFLMKLKSHI